MAFNRIGYGQVEPNQLSGIKTGQIFASLPLDTDVTTLQNGEFMYYDYTSGKVTATLNTKAAGLEPYLVYNEVKIYEPWLSYKDFAMIRVGDNYVTSDPIVGRVASANADGAQYGGGALTTGATINHSAYDYRMNGIAPRLVKTNVGDIYTTNMVDTTGTYDVGDVLTLEKTSRNTLELKKSGTITTIKFIVVKVYTMPDGQPGLKLQRIV